MKKRIISFLLVLAMILPAYTIVYAEESSIVVLYTNDVHCAIDDYAVLAAYRAELISKGNAVVTVDAGDAIQGEVIGTQTEGLAVVDIMNAVGYDYAVPGNHEYDYGMETFLDLANNQAEYEYISSNFYDLTNLSPVLKPYGIKAVGGKKIAFVGISTPETISKSTPSYFKDENGNFIYGFPTVDMEEGELYETVQASVNSALAEGADIVVAVGHLGIAETTEGWKSINVIANTNGIDYFIDAHSHETFESSTYKNKNGEDVVLTSTGTKFANFGALTIKSNGNVEFKLINPDSVDVDAMSASGKEAYAKVKSKVDGYNAQIEELYGAIGSSEAELVVSDSEGWLVRKQETNMGDFVTDAYRYVTGADVAICNGGGVRSAITVGDVSRKTLMDINPWGNAMCVVEITGKQLLYVLEHGARSCPESLGGFFQISGASFEIHTYNESPVITDQNGNFIGIDETKEPRVQNVLVNGEALDLEKKYTVAGSQYVLTEGGDGLTMLDGATVVAKDGLPCDYDMLIKYFTEGLAGNITADMYGNPDGDGRIAIYTTLDKADYSINVGETITATVFPEYLEKPITVTFVPEESGRYVFEGLDLSLLDTYCELYEVGNEELLTYSDDDLLFNFRLVYNFEAGKTYRFEVVSYESFEFKLDMALSCYHSFEGDTCTVCGEKCNHAQLNWSGKCDCGANYEGKVLEAEVEYTYNSNSFDIYKFVPEESSLYNFKSTNHTDDPKMYLCDEEGAYILQFDDSETNWDFNGNYMLIAGRAYYVVLLDHGAEPFYNFTVKCLNRKLGDVNNDGEVDNLDASAILKYDAGITDFEDDVFEIADLNMDGYIDNLDAALALKYDAGILDWDDLI